jgi:hypothetical protein
MSELQRLCGRSLLRNVHGETVKTDRKKLIAKLDALWRVLVKDRDEHRCQYNGCINPGTDAHHIFGRGHSVRWDLDNGITLCRSCHDYARDHKENFNAVMWLQMGFIFDGLHEKAKIVVHYKSADLLAILEGLKMSARLITEKPESLAGLPTSIFQDTSRGV